MSSSGLGFWVSDLGFEFRVRGFAFYDLGFGR